MKEKIKIGIEFLKKKLRLSVVLLTLLFGLLILAISYSYAFFTVSLEKKDALTLTVGSLSYTLTSDSMNEKQEVTVKANSMLTFTVRLKSNNDINSLYQFYYSGTLPSGVSISYKTSVPDGVIEKGATEVIVLAIENKNNSSKTITIGVQGGLLNKPLEQEKNTTPIKGLYQVKKPTITINTTTVTINAGESYQVMTGVSAKDPYGKDITNKISYSPTSWNNHTIGTTKITYKVTDDYGQSTSSTRSITVNRVYLFHEKTAANTTLTGGFTRYVTTANVPTFYSSYNKLSIQKNHLGNYVMYGAVTSSTNVSKRSVYSLATNKLIDLSKYNKLSFMYEGEVTPNKMSVGCYTDFTNIDNLKSVVQSTFQTNGTRTVSLNISSKKTSCYVGIIYWSTEATTDTKTEMDVYNIWLE